MKMKIWIFIAILTIILSAGFFSVSTYFMANLSKIGNYNTKEIIILVSIIITTSIIGFCFYFLNYYIVIKVKTLFRENIKVRITNKILNLSYSEIEEINSAIFISWYSNDLDVLTKDRYGAIFEIFNFSTLLLANLITMFIFSPWLSLFGLISILMLLVILTISSKLLNKINISISTGNQSYKNNLVDVISGY
ncbi:ABC transporter ATP-binding protein [Spiroplasma taiwanense]|uniref:ABC transmembrane type-1 domain-containing protein n=1 Tax=Spiroplasma taiwanense CT-1 TaxID=1276220 RepID=S5LX90_9MOLU|nr:ABC transporter transmembrane domain-containing protein [Spiroplasma taiwanense]AGR41241.1 hypothetical protein STAIW_v1c06200 [Spiroplasma taiwanense CT-1]